MCRIEFFPQYVTRRFGWWDPYTLILVSSGVTQPLPNYIVTNESYPLLIAFLQFTVLTILYYN